MKRLTLRKRFVVSLLMTGLAIYLASCGTIIHPERRGQPAGTLDPAIVVLDAVGLLLFFIPGIIAFAVDFSNGTIYLPSESAVLVPVPAGSQSFKTIHVEPAQLTPQKLEEVVGEQTGQPVRLEAGAYRATQISNIDEFSPRTLEQMQSTPTPSKVIFRGSSR
jgi:hypothetical protein